MMHIAICPACNRVRVVVRKAKQQTVIRPHRAGSGLCDGSRTPARRPMPLRSTKPARQRTGGGAA